MLSLWQSSLLTMTFAYFILSTRQLRDLNSVTHVFEIKPGFGGVGTIIDLKMNTKLKLKKKKKVNNKVPEMLSGTKSRQEVILLRLISFLLYCTFEAILIQCIACVRVHTVLGVSWEISTAVCSSQMSSPDVQSLEGDGKTSSL